MGSRKNRRGITYDYSFKVLSIGDSGVGKSSLLLSFISNYQEFPRNLSPTIGVDFKIKLLTTGGKKPKLTIWDTVYDVTRRETFTNLSQTWMKELERYCTNPDCIKILVGNKVDREGERAVTTEEGIALAKEHKCLFLECSAKTRANVKQCFKELTVKILEVPSLLEKVYTRKEPNFKAKSSLTSKTQWQLLFLVQKLLIVHWSCITIVSFLPVLSTKLLIEGMKNGYPPFPSRHVHMPFHCVVAFF